jgi:CheY-like chemotaxis protein
MVTQSAEINQSNLPILFACQQTNYFMPTILIVEDDEDNRLLLKALLEMWSYRVIEAKDGIAALETAKKVCPDLIVMDVKLPLLDGLETTRQIRQTKEICALPIIFLSGCAEAKYRAEAAEVGANAYLVKPFNFDELQSVITEQVRFSFTH